MADLIQEVVNSFTSYFKKEPLLMKSPGRVNLLGEHTDYNGGFVLPAAVDMSIILAMAPNDSEQAHLFAIDKGDDFTSDISGNIKVSGKGWPDYILGIVDILQKEGYEIGGFDVVFGGNIPIGAGLSSSAALEGGIITGLAEIYDLDISKRNRALLAQKAENEFVGVQCGIMDQFVNIHGEAGQALKLDCRSLEYQFYPFEQDEVHIVLCDTKIRRELTSSEYNIRRKQCERGVKLLAQFEDSVESLRDVSLDLLETHKDVMEPLIYKRCKYVIKENKRVEDACCDLQNGDVESFGRRMYGSHVGLSEMYEVSCRELDILVDQARTIEGVLGARMMGGGFGGCTINLVKGTSVKAFSNTMREQYGKIIGKDIDIYRTQIGAGAEVINIGKK